MNINILPAVFLAFAVSYIITPKVITLAFKIGAVDKPGERKIHERVMPRLGGLAIYLSFVLTILIMLPADDVISGLLWGSTVIVILGVIDDVRELSPKIKLLGQIVAALVVVSFGIKVHFVTHPIAGTISLGKMVIPFTVLWIVGITNAINLVDGLDGLAAGVSAIAALTMAVVAYMEGQVEAAFLAFVLFAATAGFIRFNFYPARVFMGDTGSMFLGFSLSVLAIQGLTKSATVISLFIPVVILGIPILDTIFAILRRILKRNPIFQADKEHLHHHLLELGLSHKQAVLAMYGVSICLGGSAVLLSKVTTEQSVMILIILSTLILVAADRIGLVREKMKRPFSEKRFRFRG